jgi:glycine/D-amino acid oxidase-like deaminating enzyme
MKFRKTETVEARRYEGPRITVVHDELGEATANAGDYLVGTGRGKIRVIAAAQFEREYSAYDEPDEERQLEWLREKVKTLEDALAAARAENAALAQQGMEGLGQQVEQLNNSTELSN